MNPEQAAKLRDPFPPEQIGHLPRGGITLDYVGHAATTDRLLKVDPSWSWVPMATQPDGAPILVTEKTMFADPTARVGLWIKLLVCDVETPGFGEGKNLKEAIGDAIRNAAMRRGVALDLWAKEDLGATAAASAAPAQAAAASTSPGQSEADGNGEPDQATPAQHRKLAVVIKQLEDSSLDPPADHKSWGYYAKWFAKEKFGVESRAHLTKEQMGKLIDRLETEAVPF